ncbi:lipase 3-like [Vanessa atalanta]|uniref:lipase 3-like n=1 Tax=Vanessa atalanta TaxID=42275 RepID=UPI001FCD17F4|nr:lipase 3-like [Vanessa atalanta]
MLGIVLLSCVAVVAGGRSPHADYIEKLIKTNAFGTRVSDNITEDATLDLPDLVRKYNYPFEEHFVTTEDGYILGVHRIPHGRSSNNIPGERPVVFLMHGLLSSSAEHVIPGPGSGLAYLLADEGYDVWMGNARGTYYSRRHLNLNPDALFNVDFWQFSFDEIGNKDLPAMIDYVLMHTGRSALHYIGFSQGSTVFFVMCSLQPQYNDKIISMHALAPVAYMAYNKSPIFLALAPFSKDIANIASQIGIGEFLPNREIYTWAGQALCMDGMILQPICSSILFLIGGWNEDQHNATMLPVVFGHIPAGASVMQLAHFGQSIADKEFRRFDFGTLQNLLRYGTAIPPRYDLSKVVAPAFFHYSESDPLAEVEDVYRLFRELGRPMEKIRVPDSNFSHLDFLWGIDAKDLVYDRLINLLKMMD